MLIFPGKLVGNYASLLITRVHDYYIGLNIYLTHATFATAAASFTGFISQIIDQSLIPFVKTEVSQTNNRHVQKLRSHHPPESFQEQSLFFYQHNRTVHWHRVQLADSALGI